MNRAFGAEELAETTRSEGFGDNSFGNDDTVREKILGFLCWNQTEPTPVTVLENVEQFIAILLFPKNQGKSQICGGG